MIQEKSKVQSKKNILKRTKNFPQTQNFILLLISLQHYGVNLLNFDYWIWNS